MCVFIFGIRSTYLLQFMISVNWEKSKKNTNKNEDYIVANYIHSFMSKFMSGGLFAYFHFVLNTICAFEMNLYNLVFDGG